MKYTFVNQRAKKRGKKNRENNDTIDKFILWGKGVNVLIPISQ